MAEGDRNTRFFHAQDSKRANKNWIESLRDDTEVLQQSTEDVGRIAVDYFQSIFTSEQPSVNEIAAVVNTMSVKVNQTINQDLSREFTPTEVRTALFDMYPTKSPGRWFTCVVLSKNLACSR